MEILINSYLKDNQKNKLKIQKATYKPELKDLYSLHEFIILNRRITVLEFGCGWSSLVILNALRINKSKYSKRISTLRFHNPFELFAIDNEKKFLNIAKNRVKKVLKDHYKFAKFYFSDAQMDTHNNQICNSYKKLPLVNPDFIYLDGPDQFKIKNKIKNINIGHPDFMPMNSDILYLEPFLKPGTIILTDGRTANFRFLINNLKRNWVYKENFDSDQHYLFLNEEPLGFPNLNQLKFYK